MDNKMHELVVKLNEYATYYYDANAPLISDVEYDALYDELLKLEKEQNLVLFNSPTRRVGGKIKGGFLPHKHISRLLSMDKCKTYDELRSWDTRIKKRINEDIEYTLEYKFDGITVNLTYENGILVQAATRGNGIQGEGILSQAKTISSIPLTIDYKGILEVHGEGIMHLSTLERFNKESDESLKNARNAAAGALRNLDPKVTKSRHLDCYFYQIGFKDLEQFNDHGQMMEFIKAQGLNVNDYFIKCKSIDDVIKNIEKVLPKRSSLDYLIDGIVICVYDYKQRQALGNTHKFPRWQMAFKFEAEEVTTKILDITWQIGRTGRITPVAELETVDIAGVSVKRATLNNFDDIQRKNIKIGARALVRRSNDVIPEVMGVVDDEGKEVELIKRCPACDDELKIIGAHLYCMNSLSCPPQMISKLVHYGSRDAMDIETFNDKTARQLYQELGMKTLADLYTINKEDLLTLDGFKEKKADNLINAIENSKLIELSRFLYALGIANVGLKTSRDLSKYYKNFDDIRNANVEELIQIQDVGDIVAKSIVDFFSDKNNKKIIDALFEHGVLIEETQNTITKESLKDKIFVITGTLEGYVRKDAAKLIEENGGTVTGSVSKKTTYLLAGENAGSKLIKAQKLGIDVIDIEALITLIDND